MRYKQDDTKRLRDKRLCIRTTGQEHEILKKLASKYEMGQMDLIIKALTFYDLHHEEK